MKFNYNREPLVDYVNRLVRRYSDEIINAALEIYNNWTQDDEGYSEQYGYGGICDDIAYEIADVFQDVINDERFDIFTMYNEYECHTAVYIAFHPTRELVRVDIPPYVYETGGGYTWKKIPDAKIDSNSIVVEDYSDVYDEFSEYYDENYTDYHLVDERAKSKAQQRLFGMALAYKRGELSGSQVSDTVKKLASSMSLKQLTDFAATKHDNLPAKKTKQKRGKKKNESVSLIGVFDDIINETVRHAREEMPQLFDSKKVVNFLKKIGIECKKEKVDPLSLVPMQDDIDSEKVLDLVDAKKLDPVFISLDNYILDGHHRVVAAIVRNEKIDAYRIMLYHRNAYDILTDAKRRVKL